MKYDKGQIHVQLRRTPWTSCSNWHLKYSAKVFTGQMGPGMCSRTRGQKLESIQGSVSLRGVSEARGGPWMQGYGADAPINNESPLEVFEPQWHDQSWGVVTQQEELERRDTVLEGASICWVCQMCGICFYLRFYFILPVLWNSHFNYKGEKLRHNWLNKLPTSLSLYP